MRSLSRVINLPDSHDMVWQETVTVAFGGEEMYLSSWCGGGREAERLNRS